MKTSWNNINWLLYFSLLLFAFIEASYYMTFETANSTYVFGYNNIQPLSYQIFTYKFVHLNSSHFIGNFSFLIFYYLIFVLTSIVFAKLFEKNNKILLINKIYKYMFFVFVLYFVLEALMVFLWSILSRDDTHKIILGASGVCFFITGYFTTNNIIMIGLYSKYKKQIFLIFSVFISFLMVYYIYQLIYHKDIFFTNATFVFHKLAQILSIIASLYILFVNYKKEIFIKNK